MVIDDTLSVHVIHEIFVDVKKWCEVIGSIDYGLFRAA